MYETGQLELGRDGVAYLPGATQVGGATELRLLRADIDVALRALIPLVFAGSYPQAKEWARQNALYTPEWIYVNTPDQIRGRRYPRVILVGTYPARPDYADFARECERAEARIGVAPL